MSTETKDTNPKDAIGSGKLPLHLIPGTAKAYMAIAFLEGALKYGKYNWRVAGVRASIYLDALERHLESYKNGEWADPETDVPHIASMMACLGILADAHECGKLTDDRPPRAETGRLIRDRASIVKRLHETFRDHNPHQYTIADSPTQSSEPIDTTCHCGHCSECVMRDQIDWVDELSLGQLGPTTAEILGEAEPEEEPKEEPWTGGIRLLPIGYCTRTLPYQGYRDRPQQFQRHLAEGEVFCDDPDTCCAYHKYEWLEEPGRSS